MSNELNNIVGNMTNGVLEGVAIGGDRYACSSMVGRLIISPHNRYPSSTFVDHIQRFHDDPAVKMIVLLGEVGLLGDGRCCMLPVPLSILSLPHPLPLLPYPAPPLAPPTLTHPLPLLPCPTPYLPLLPCPTPDLPLLPCPTPYLPLLPCTDWGRGGV